MAAANDDVSKELEEMNKRLEKVASGLREMRSKLDKETKAVQDQAEKEEVDARSIYVGNVDYECTPEEVQSHFDTCGIINRVTILTDEFGQPKGYAYVEFNEVEGMQQALTLNETELLGRQLKVLPKRTNVPGMSQSHSPYGYGKVPRLRRPMRYMPY